MNKDILTLIDILLQELMGNKKPFGGKIMVLCGDFRQTLPIIEGTNSEVLIVDNSLLNLPLFVNRFKKMKLRRNMRAITEEDSFKKWLMSIGSGV